MSWIDTAFVWTGLAAQVGLIALLIWRRAYTRLPLFCLYMVWALVTDSLGLFLESRTGSYNRFYIYEMPLDCLLQFCVLVELSWSILKPLQASLPRWTVPALAALVLLAGAIFWPIAGATLMHGLPAEWLFFLRLRQTSSMLQILFFLVLAAGSHLFSINWHDRELQVATGLGFFSLVSLGVSLLHAQMPQLVNYHKIDMILPLSYLCALGYWGVSFAQKETARQEFTPQMRSFLLTVSGAAHSGRIALQGNDLRGNRRG